MADLRITLVHLGHLSHCRWDEYRLVVAGLRRNRSLI
jgi:hypothetical protein